jgi:hypothetical protein
MGKFMKFIYILFFITAVSCGGHKKYSDVRKFTDEVARTQDEFLSQIEKSTNSDEAVSAINTFGDKLLKLSEKSMQIKKNYPDVETWASNPPPELKEELEKLDDPESQLQKVFSNDKIRVIIKEKKVQDAFTKLNVKMENVKFFQ